MGLRAGLSKRAILSPAGARIQSGTPAVRDGPKEHRMIHRTRGPGFTPAAAARPGGFTLVELLVVVTIIVVLLALLTPALSKAVYQGQLVQCAGRLKASSAAVVQYAFDHRRSYPTRGVAELDPEGTGQFYLNPMQVVNPLRDYDVRRPLRGYIPSFNEYLQDPLVQPIELDDEGLGVVVETSYMMMWGWQYRVNRQPGRGMFRLGDRFTVEGDNQIDPGRGYNVLIGDVDLNYPVSGEIGGAQSSHPDRSPPLMRPMVWNEHFLFGARWNLSRWQMTNSLRGPLDTNYAHDDLAVTRYDHVVGWARARNRTDERMDRIPLEFNGERLFDLYDRFHVPR
jgi:prepilin-type N-terminal cleavage/methylation domain-containing protein